MVGLASVKTEEVNQDLGPLNKAENDSKSTLNIDILKETQNTNSDVHLENRENDTFGTGTPIKVVKTDPSATDAGSSSFLYRSPYAQPATGFPNYSYPVTPMDSKELSPLPINNKMTVPLLPVSSGTKDLLQPTKSDKHLSSHSLNPPKERDNFRCVLNFKSFLSKI